MVIYDANLQTTSLRYASARLLSSSDIRLKFQTLQVVYAYMKSLGLPSSTGHACDMLVQYLIKICDEDCSSQTTIDVSISFVMTALCVMLCLCACERQNLVDGRELPLKKVMMEGLRVLEPAIFSFEEPLQSAEVLLLTARKEFVRSILLLYFPAESHSQPRYCSLDSVDCLLKEINSSEAFDARAEANTPPSFRNYVPTQCGILEESLLRILTSFVSPCDERTGFDIKV